MYKELELNDKPPVSCYQHHAYALGILGCSEECAIWLCNYYVQLIYCPDLGINSFNFLVEFLTHQNAFICESVNDDLINYLKLDKKTIVKHAIDCNKYVWFCFDEYSIPDRALYQKKHFVHDCLLYGYNEEREEFKIFGYNNTGKCVTSVIKYDEFDRSKPSLIKTVQKNPEYEFVLDIRFIIESLEKYLNIREEFTLDLIAYQCNYFHVKNSFEPCFCGMEAVERWKNMIVDEINMKEYIDLRPFSVFYEHKKIMCIRMSYISKKIQELQKYIEAVESIERNARILINLALKYNVDKKSITFQRIIKQIDEIVEKEKSILCVIVNILKKYDRNNEFEQ